MGEESSVCGVLLSRSEVFRIAGQSLQAILISLISDKKATVDHILVPLGPTTHSSLQTVRSLVPGIRVSLTCLKSTTLFKSIQVRQTTKRSQLNNLSSKNDSGENIFLQESSLLSASSYGDTCGLVSYRGIVTKLSDEDGGVFCLDKRLTVFASLLLRVSDVAFPSLGDDISVHWAHLSRYENKKCLVLCGRACLVNHSLTLQNVTDDSNREYANSCGCSANTASINICYASDNSVCSKCSPAVARGRNHPFVNLILSYSFSLSNFLTLYGNYKRLFEYLGENSDTRKFLISSANCEGSRIKRSLCKEYLLHSASCPLIQHSAHQVTSFYSAAMVNEALLRSGDGEEADGIVEEVPGYGFSHSQFITDSDRQQKLLGKLICQEGKYFLSNSVSPIPSTTTSPHTTMSSSSSSPGDIAVVLNQACMALCSAVGDWAGSLVLVDNFTVAREQWGHTTNYRNYLMLHELTLVSEWRKNVTLNKFEPKCKYLVLAKSSVLSTKKGMRGEGKFFLLQVLSESVEGCITSDGAGRTEYVVVDDLTLFPRVSPGCHLLFSTPHPFQLEPAASPLHHMAANENLPGLSSFLRLRPSCSAPTSLHIDKNSRKSDTKTYRPSFAAGDPTEQSFHSFKCEEKNYNKKLSSYQVNLDDPIDFNLFEQDPAFVLGREGLVTWDIETLLMDHRGGGGVSGGMVGCVSGEVLNTAAVILGREWLIETGQRCRTLCLELGSPHNHEEYFGQEKKLIQQRNLEHNLTSIRLYLTHWSQDDEMGGHALGLVPGAIFNFNSVERRVSKAGQVYLATTIMTSVEFVSLAESAGGDLAHLPQNHHTRRRLTDLSQLLTLSLATVAECIVTLDDVVKISISVECGACGCPVEGLTCSYVGCNARDIPHIYTYKGVFEVSDCTGCGVLICNSEQNLASILNISTEEMSRLQHIAASRGNLTYSKWHQKEENDHPNYRNIRKLLFTAAFFLVRVKKFGNSSSSRSCSNSSSRDDMLKLFCLTASRPSQTEINSLVERDLGALEEATKCM